MKAIVLYLFFVQFLINSCVPPSCSKSAQSAHTQINYYLMVSELAKEKYGDTFTIQENETKEFYLVSSRSKSPSETSIKFFIYEKEKQLIIHEDLITLGSVKWTERYKIDIQKFPGAVKLNDQNMDKHGYLLNVKTGEKIKK
ncbi:MAG: hypothetical protein M0Q21_10610 [Ignavibacteriaceae bacterium]|nr:hypothetical protein [Ignavibacteriaceae bacterium]